MSLGKLLAAVITTLGPELGDSSVARYKGSHWMAWYRDHTTGTSSGYSIFMVILMTSS